jgi:hypothetical protein
VWWRNESVVLGVTNSGPFVETLQGKIRKTDGDLVEKIASQRKTDTDLIYTVIKINLARHLSKLNTLNS